MRRDDRRNRELLGDTSNRALSRGRAALRASNKLAVVTGLLVAGTAALLVASVAELPALLLFALAVLTVGVGQTCSPAFRKRFAAVRSDPAPTLPDVLDFRDQVVGSLIFRVGQARQARSQVLARSPYGARHALSASAAAIGEIERRAIVLAARADHVSGALRELSRGLAQADAEVIRLRSAGESAPCAAARTAYGRAALWSAGRGETVQKLEARRTALLAGLEHVAAILETIPATATELELCRIDEEDGVIGTDAADAESHLSALAASYEPLGAEPAWDADPS